MMIKMFFIFMGLSLIIPSYAAFPCTLFGAIGDSVQGGGVLIGTFSSQPSAASR
jgi:hypothetical protein